MAKTTGQWTANQHMIHTENDKSMNKQSMISSKQKNNNKNNLCINIQVNLETDYLLQVQTW